jgi:hypothetical protein
MGKGHCARIPCYLVPELTGKNCAHEEAIRTLCFVRMKLDGTNEEVIEIPGL